LFSVDILVEMTVTFVPPRTLIGSTALTAVVTSASPMALDEDEDEGRYVDEEMAGLEDDQANTLISKKLVVPGQLVTDDPQFMR
jgi:hypothetical protein